MKVTIGNYTVTGESSEEHAAGFRFAFTRDIQARKGFRRTHVQPSNRKNQLVTITFAVARLFESYEAALIYLMDHSENVPQSGVVKFEHDLNGEQVIRQFDAAYIAAVEGVPFGATTFVQYTVIGNYLE